MPPVQRRNTRQRRLVLEAVRDLDCHPTAGQVYDYVHERDERVSLGTVYRNLRLLSDEGSILAVKAPGGYHYDHRTDEHDHVVCRSCGRMVDADLPHEEATDALVEETTGFVVESHYTVFEGLCPNCQLAAAGSDSAAR